jgi:hypothetical protein
MVKIIVPKGVRYLPGNKNEGEHIFPRGAVFEFVSRERGTATLRLVGYKRRELPTPEQLAA